MAEMQDPKTKTEDGADRAKASPELIARRRAIKRLAFQTWRKDWRKANPEASAEERKEAWAQVARDERTKLKRTLRGFEKFGYKLVPVEADA